MNRGASKAPGAVWNPKGFRIYIRKKVTCFCGRLSLFQELEAHGFPIHPFNIPASHAWRVMGCVTSRQFITDSTQTIIRTHSYRPFIVASYWGRRSEGLEGIHTGTGERANCKKPLKVSGLELNWQKKKKTIETYWKNWNIQKYIIIGLEFCFGRKGNILFNH